ncbi:MAG: TrkA family potassium uptake protein [Firmicutes bacterium]|nr:TrkA family potassium uptake protein [Bacillota bacterium]
MRKQVMVIGVGRFGSSVALNLVELGHDVLVVDKNQDLIQQISTEVTNAVVANAASESGIQALGVNNFDAIVLAIGNDEQASILAAILLIEAGASYIVAKAQNDLHGKVLNKIGVHRVIYPERDMGHKIAHSLFASNIIDLIELSSDYSVVEVSAPQEMVGQTLKNLDLRARFGVSVIALRRNHGSKTNISPAADDRVMTGDIIVAIGENKALKKLEWI